MAAGCLDDVFKYEFRGGSGKGIFSVSLMTQSRISCLLLWGIGGETREVCVRLCSYSGSHVFSDV